jgi:hypothetical protein
MRERYHTARIKEENKKPCTLLRIESGQREPLNEKIQYSMVEKQNK